MNDDKYESIVNEAFSYELKKTEPPTLIQYIRSLRNNEFRKDELNRIFSKGPIIRDPETNEAYTNPLKVLGDTFDYVNDQVSLKKLSPMLKFLPEDNTPSVLKDVADYSLKDFQYDVTGAVEEKVSGMTDSQFLGGLAAFGTALTIPDATDALFPGGADTIKFAKRIDGKRLKEIFDGIFDGGSPFTRAVTPEGVEVPNTFFMSKSDDATGGISKKGFSSNITKKNLELFNQIGWTGTAKLDIQDMLYGFDDAGKPLMSQYKRRVLKAGIGDETFNWGAFTKNRNAVVKDFLDGLQDLKIDPKTIHGHHISALRITSSLFDGLSPIQRKKLIKIFQREGLQLGNHPDNLMALHQSTHLDVVHPFLEKQIGKYGQLLIDPAKIKKMNPKQREELVVRFAKIIKKSEEIALNDTRKWLDKEFLNMSPEAAFQAKLGMLEDAFQKEVALRELLLDNVVYPRRTSKNVKFKNLMKKVEKQLKLDDIDSPKQLEIWDIDDNTLKMFSDLLNQN